MKAPIASPHENKDTLKSRIEQRFSIFNVLCAFNVIVGGFVSLAWMIALAMSMVSNWRMSGFLFNSQLWKGIQLDVPLIAPAFIVCMLSLWGLVRRSQ